MHGNAFYRRAAMSGRHGHRHGPGGWGHPGDFGALRGWGGGRRRRMRRGDVRAALLDAGSLRVPIQRGYGVEEAGEALAAPAATHTQGKLAISVA